MNAFAYSGSACSSAPTRPRKASGRASVAEDQRALGEHLVEQRHDVAEPRERAARLGVAEVGHVERVALPEGAAVRDRHDEPDAGGSEPRELLEHGLGLGDVLERLEHHDRVDVARARPPQVLERVGHREASARSPVRSRRASATLLASTSTPCTDAAVPARSSVPYPVPQRQVEHAQAGAQLRGQRVAMQVRRREVVRAGEVVVAQAFSEVHARAPSARCAATSPRSRSQRTVPVARSMEDDRMR